MVPLAEATFAELQASIDPIDRQIVDLLTRFADGVNQYVQHVKDGVWTIDPLVADSFSIRSTRSSSGGSRRSRCRGPPRSRSTPPSCTTASSTSTTTRRTAIPRR
jgi:hypothetical protein